ncbi:MAG TPA: metal ABC transporter permease [Microbacteriaceae bacterium]|nr:metal ABC transporter permease [Microbacteriaceae bacterium]
MAEYLELLSLVHNSLIAAAVLGLMGGLIGVFVMTRDMAFAVHGIAELTFAGAAAALMLGTSVSGGALVGALIAAVIIGAFGEKARARNSIVAVLMPFGLGLGILFLSLAPGRSANKFGLLTGQIVAIADQQVGLTVVLAGTVIVALLVMWRPLLFASVDAHVAASRGVKLRTMSISFVMLLALAVAVSVQLIGALLVLALLVTPAAAALKLSSSPVLVPVLAAGFAMLSMVGGILLALPWPVPVSPFITSLAFLTYLAAWAIGARSKGRRRA